MGYLAMNMEANKKVSRRVPNPETQRWFETNGRSDYTVEMTLSNKNGKPVIELEEIGLR